VETHGYCGRILHIDLSTGKTKTSDLDFEMTKRFIRDIGINLRLAYDLIKPGIDPLSPENVIIIGAGSLESSSHGLR
jgi:aldehyde:ferredoxin oxidoreductase